jgi:predicted nucleotidyltransferase component of viral defense system
MKRAQVTNIAASVRTRLLSLSKKTGEDYQFVLQRYTAERFLYRLGESRHRQHFVLKGAMLFALWGGPAYRSTRDLDFAGYGSTEIEDVLRTMRDICLAPVVEDGVVFDSETLSAEPIRDDAEYHGLRIKFRAHLGEARIQMQIDVGFGDAIEPAPVESTYPTLLDDPAPQIRAYPRESVVAEKLHALVILGERNSRYKDFFDLYSLAEQVRFGGGSLARSVAATFQRRRTEIGTDTPTALTPRFYSDEHRSAQWRAFLSRSVLSGAPMDFAEVGDTLRAFLRPVWDSLGRGEPLAGSWTPAGWNR